MEIYNLEDFHKGWFVGNFDPTLFMTNDFEISVKRFTAGETEPLHLQLVATEITVVVTGKIKLGGRAFSAGDVIRIPPQESADFEAVTDCNLVCVKFPSIPNDKVIL
jgi:hypothetical protein